MVRGFGESRDLLLSPSRSDLVVQSCFFFPCSKSRDLGPEHGFRACSFKNKWKKSDFQFFGGQKTNKIREQLNEIGQILVPRALNDTKKIRKAGADIFANFGAEKPRNTCKKNCGGQGRRRPPPPPPPRATKVTLTRIN